jgi:hypothetical protein
MARRVTCRIDGQTVSRAEFDRFLATLEGSEDWYCAETTTGGETGWKMKDARGVVYDYTAVQDGDTSTLEIQRLPQAP